MTDEQPSSHGGTTLSRRAARSWRALGRRECTRFYRAKEDDPGLFARTDTLRVAASSGPRPPEEENAQSC
jgi:hypothetical protein